MRTTMWSRSTPSPNHASSPSEASAFNFVTPTVGGSHLSGLGTKKLWASGSEPSRYWQCTSRRHPFPYEDNSRAYLLPIFFSQRWQKFNLILQICMPNTSSKSHYTNDIDRRTTVYLFNSHYLDITLLGKK